jgi:hypothetical protein
MLLPEYNERRCLRKYHDRREPEPDCDIAAVGRHPSQPTYS